MRLEKLFLTLTLALSLALVPGAVHAEGSGHCHDASADEKSDEAESTAAAELDIPDTPVVDQDGNNLRFGSDLIDGKVVAVNFVFTTCTTVCPPMGANFGKLQSLLGDRAGKDVHLVSVSIDPAVDTPQRLAAWGERFGAGDAWTLVTGDKPRVDGLLQQLGVFVAEKRFHSPIVLLGNAKTGEWRRANGLTPASQLLEQLDDLMGSEAHASNKGDASAHTSDSHDHSVHRAAPAKETRP